MTSKSVSYDDVYAKELRVCNAKLCRDFNFLTCVMVCFTYILKTCVLKQYCLSPYTFKMKKAANFIFIFRKLFGNTLRNITLQMLRNVNQIHFYDWQSFTFHTFASTQRFSDCSTFAFNATKTYPSFPLRCKVSVFLSSFLFAFLFLCSPFLSTMSRA